LFGGGFSFKKEALSGVFESVAKAFSKLKDLFVQKSETVPTENRKPAFCGKRECPPFTTKNKTKSYEVRCYASANWVSTKDVGDPKAMSPTAKSMFMKLFKYIQGANSQKTKIEMTVPVLTRISGDGSQKSLKMSFYLPQKFQQNVPAPTDPSVTVDNNKFCAYVHSFRSSLFSTKYEQHMHKLRKDLDAAGLQGKYSTAAYITAGYDGPSKWFNRYNEVMLLAV